MPEGNPAERLERVCIEIVNTKPHGVTLARILPRLADVHAPKPDEDGDDEQESPESPKLDQSQLLHMFGALVALPHDVREIIRTFDPQTEDLEHLEQPLRWVEKGFREFGLNGTVKDYERQLDAETMSSLRHLTKALHRNGYRERAVDLDGLRQLRDEVATLFDKVRAAGIDDDLKRFALKHLEAVERGIRHFQIEGVPPLDASMDQFLGDMVRDRGEEDRRGLRRFLERDSVGREVLAVFSELNDVMDFAKFGMTLGAAVVGFELGSG